MAGELTDLWSKPRARLPLGLLALSMIIVAGYFLHSLLISEPPPPKAAEVTSRKILVKGAVRYPRGIQPDPTQSVRVFLSIPEIALQKEVSLKPGDDGHYEIAIEVPTETPKASYQIEASLGDQRWVSQPRTSLVLNGSEPVVEVVAESAEAAYQVGLAELPERPAKGTEAIEAAAQRREERQARREQRDKMREERRQSRRRGR